ncbi:p21-activated protein kinase-interacting protein 1-like [Diadema setosum]|uniref:p21-activated protein kinase-interacting protein 1-like n=1 Tax=Diadema setosum TaxID=31175 RepID=UPI003B3B4688
MAAHMCCQVFSGCYERTVFGYDLLEKEGENGGELVFRGQFTNNAHIGCVESIAASSKFLASGSTDELIYLFDVEEKVELGSLMQHDGSISSLAFHEDSHMISGSEDGKICVWSTQSWECMKVMKGHKDAVNSVAVHPSGKLALSVGKDKTLRTWNLLKGRAAYTTNIKAVSEIVLWSPDGQLYVVVIDDRIDVYDITTATIVCSCKCSSRILTACFITDRIITVAGEGETIQILRVDAKERRIKTLVEFKAHENRIKALKCTRAYGSQSRSCERWLFSASSDGYIKLWCVDTEKVSDAPALLSKVNTKARLTCLAVREVSKPQESQKGSSQQAAKRPQDQDGGDSVAKKKKKKGKP